MPTYEYECLKCKRTFEVDQNINDPHLKRCVLLEGQTLTIVDGKSVKCKGKVKRLISASTSFVLKGNGWFRTGY